MKSQSYLATGSACSLGFAVVRGLSASGTGGCCCQLDTQLLGQLQLTTWALGLAHDQNLAQSRMQPVAHIYTPLCSGNRSSSQICPSNMTLSMLSFLACLLLGTASICQAQASASAFASVSTVCLCRGCQDVSSHLPAWCALGL